MTKQRNTLWTKKTYSLAVAGALAVSLMLTAFAYARINLRETPASQPPRGIAGSDLRTELIIATDLHYLSPELTNHGAFFTSLIENADGKTMEYSEEVIEAFVDMVIEKKPEALILTGDLTFNGAKKSHEDLAEKLERVRDAGVQVLILSGNHDLNSSSAASFEGDGYRLVEGVTPEEFEEIYKNFGFQGACSRDEASLSYMWELKPGLRLVMLDVNGVEQEGTVPEETLAWLEEQLMDAEREHAEVLSFSHQNLLRHSMFTEGYVIANSQEVLALYGRYGVSVNFSGHLHIQHMAEQEGLTEIATSALSVAPTQYARVVMDGPSLEYHTSSVDVPGWAAARELTDENLLDFHAYAETFFTDNSYRQAMTALRDMDDEDMAEAMARYHADQNKGYYAGIQADRQEEMLRAWKNSSTFFGTYLSSFCEEVWEDQNYKVIPL